jgi:hypothetical protein
MHQMLEEQFLLVHCKWEDICDFDSDMSMVNVVVVENLEVVALKSYPFRHFHLHCDFSLRSYHYPIAPSFYST